MGESRPTPEPIARQLRQESGFGCVRCGFAFVVYHHIVPWKEEHHFDPESMVAVCPNCHVAFEKMDRRKQYEYKKNPRNPRMGFPRGIMEFSSSLKRVVLQENVFEDVTHIIGANNTPLLSVGVGSARDTISLVSFARDGKVLIRIVENEIVWAQPGFWDFRFHVNFLKVQTTGGSIWLEIDCRTDPAKIRYTSFVLGGKVEVTSKGIVLDSKRVKGLRVSGLGFQGDGHGTFGLHLMTNEFAGGPNVAPTCLGFPIFDDQA